MRQRHVLLAITLLAGIGVFVSLYLLWNHYTTGPSFCKIGGAVNCDLVNRGPYGEIMGIPVSGIGVLGYVLLEGLALTLLAMKTRERETIIALQAASTLGFLFSLYLLYLELFVIFAVCPFCMVSLILITIITTLAWTACSVPNRWSNGSGAGVEPPNHITQNGTGEKRLSS